MAYIRPTVAQFKAQFFRDFPFAPEENGAPGTDATKVMDGDILAAQLAAACNFAESLLQDQATFAYAFNLLTAHYLVTSLLSSAQGIQGQGEWVMQNKSAGNLSTAFAIPERILANPTMALLGKTRYGLQYLELMLPKLIGHVITVYGPTKP